MTEPADRSAPSQEDADRLEDSLEAMDRPARAIPPPDADADNEDGADEITGLVP